MKFIAEVYWDRGSREVNQDSISLQEVSAGGKRVLFAAVCDGIGGLWQGETASGFVTERMTEWFYKEALPMLEKGKSRKKIVNAGLRVLNDCNEELGQFAGREDKKLGTTVTAVLIKESRFCFWHSGDTRLYRIGRSFGARVGRKGRKPLIRLTSDHTADARTLIQCIGCFAWKRPDVGHGILKKGETLLICSDGFRNRISEAKIGEALQGKELDTREVFEVRLREIAEYVKRHGEKDNISAVVIRRK